MSVLVNEHPLQSRADHSQCTEVAGDSLLLVNASNDQEVTSMTEVGNCFVSFLNSVTKYLLFFLL